MQIIGNINQHFRKIAFLNPTMKYRDRVRHIYRRIRFRKDLDIQMLHGCGSPENRCIPALGAAR
jgi:hypothetical protein